MRRDILQDFANSAFWEVLKEDLLVPLIDEVKDVTQPLVINGVKLKAEDCYYTKALTAARLKQLVSTLDRLKQEKNSTSSEDFE